MPKRLNNPASPAAEDRGPGVVVHPQISKPPRRLRPPKPVKPKPSFWRRVWLWFQVAFALFMVAVIVLGYFVYQQGLVYYARAQTYDLKKLDDVNVTSTFYDVNGEELGRIFVEDRIVLRQDQIPETMRQAVMAAEDRRFYEHGAIDYEGILRALWENVVKKNKVQGASTIEQQLAKHVIGDFSRTLDRKFLEAFVAVRLEHAYTKDQIMNYYLNRIYFGKGYFGVEAAARGYFGKDAMDLTVPECALLAGIIRAPVSSSPRTDLYKAKLRRDITLKQMYEQGFIKTHEEYSHDLNTPVHIEPAKPSGLQSYVMAAAVKEMEQILSIEGTEEMPQGLTVRTNINLRLQRAIEEQMEQHLSAIEQATPQEGTVPAVNPGMAPKAPPQLQGAAIVADLDTGRVRAWVGGRDFSRNQFDHISMAHRENGALLQPILYGLAFDRLGLSPATMINASYIDPTAAASAADLDLGDPNVELNKWFLSVQDALALGNKSAATRVGLKLGAGQVGDWLQQAGLEQIHVPSDKPNVFNPDPMTLGDVASLYQIIGNDGVRRKLKIIQSITSKDGQVLYDDTQPDRDTDRGQMLNSVDDEQLNLTLQNSLRYGFARTLTRDYGFRGTLAGMPGFSEGYRDAWFVGYTPKLLAGVWIGYDDSRAIGSRDVAMKSAVPFWGDVLRQAETRMQAGGSFPVPSTLTKVEIDRTSGTLRGLAGLAPAPGDIFVYLKQDQIAAAAAQAASPLQRPRDWSDWLTTMFNESDETGLDPSQMMESEDKRSSVIPALAEYAMPGLRGDILSSDGTVYATMSNEKNLVVSWPAADEAATDADIVKWMRARLDEAQKTIGVQVTVSDADLITQYRNQRYQPFQVLEDITPAQVAQIQAAGLEAKGFGFQSTPRRSYPRGSELAHVLGYLSRDKQRNRGKYLGGDVIYDRYKGASGVEAVCEKDLAGADGRFLISTSPDGYARSAAVAQPAAYGNNVRLAIDSKFQAAVEDAMNVKKIDAMVVMDVHTGDVVAMASHPTFDPNIFVPAISADEWQILTGDELNPLLNRAYRAQYPPGSGFKTVTSIAAMRAGVFDPNWVVHCVGYFDIGNIHMDLRSEHGDVTYNEALTHSYNTYFIELGLKVGRDYLLDTARSLNFGSPTNIDLPDELPGLIPDQEFVRRVHGRDFGPGDLANTAIGQGDVLVTPIQMADFMAALANGGTIYRPRLIRQIEDRNGKVVRDYPVQVLRTVTLDSPYMANLKAAMINVVDDGTATIARRSDFKIAAKTGTAQVGSKTHRRQIAWLSGYYPADNPQYSFSAVVQGEFSDNRNDTETGGLLGGVQGGAIVRGFMDTIYGKKGDSGVGDDDDDATAAAPASTGDTQDQTDSAKPKTNADDQDDNAPTPDHGPTVKKVDATENVAPPPSTGPGQTAP